MCNTTFGRISALNKHLKKKVCEKKKEKNNLNNYNCVFCGRSFSRKDNKRSHEKNCIPEIEKNENLVFMEKQPTLKFIRVAKDLPWTGKKLENPILIHLWEEFEEYMKRTKIVGCDLLKEHQRSDLKTSSIIDFKGRLKTFFKWLEMEKEEIYHEIQVVKTLLNHKIVLEFRLIRRKVSEISMNKECDLECVYNIYGTSQFALSNETSPVLLSSFITAKIAFSEIADGENF